MIPRQTPHREGRQHHRSRPGRSQPGQSQRHGILLFPGHGTKSHGRRAGKTELRHPSQRLGNVFLYILPLRAPYSRTHTHSLDLTGLVVPVWSCIFTDHETGPGEVVDWRGCRSVCAPKGRGGGKERNKCCSWDDMYYFILGRHGAEWLDNSMALSCIAEEEIGKQNIAKAS